MRRLLSSKSGAMDINDILPEELILQIVARLPMKSVGWCRCVSKKWRALFSDPQFGKLHFQVSPKHKSVIFLLKREFKTLDFDLSNTASFEKEPLDLEAPFDYISLRFLGSCNGLVAARDFSHFSQFDGKQEGLFIWNPFTGFFKKLPSRRFPARPGEFKDDFIIVGFGCASSNDEYKLVMGAEIFSSKTNSWKPIKIPPGDFGMRMSLGVLCRGALHWLACLDDHPGLHLYAFDLETEEFSIMKLPGAIQTQCDSIRCDFGVTCEGCLFVLASLEQDFGCVVEFWVMRVYGNSDSWTRTLCVKIPTQPHWRIAVGAISVMETGAFVRNLNPVEVKNIMSATYFSNEEQNTGIYMIQTGSCPMVVYEEGLCCLA